MTIKIAVLQRCQISIFTGLFSRFESAEVNLELVVRLKENSVFVNEIKYCRTFGAHRDRAGIQRLGLRHGAHMDRLVRPLRRVGYRLANALLTAFKS